MRDIEHLAAQGLPALSPWAFWQMNAIGDFLDLIPALSSADSWDWKNMTDAQLMDRVRKTTHCSALGSTSACPASQPRTGPSPP